MHADMSMTARSESGFSLVEVVVALLLLSVSLLGMAAAFAPTRMAIEVGNKVTTANYLARQTLEHMRNSEYSSDTDDINTTNFPTEGYGAISGFPLFKRTVLIEANTPVTNAKRVTVTVTYKDNAGVEETVRLITVFACSC